MEDLIENITTAKAEIANKIKDYSEIFSPEPFIELPPSYSNIFESGSQYYQNKKPVQRVIGKIKL